MDIDQYFNEYLKEYKNKECKDIYLLKDLKFPYILQIKQLKRYLKFKLKFDHDLSNSGKEQKIKQNEYCLIDADWIKKWKKHIGYTEIKRNFQSIYKKKQLNTIDYYNYFALIIQKNSFGNSLFPLDNNKIYNEKGIDPLKNFKIINKECYDLFRIGGNKKKNLNKSFPVIFEKKNI